MRDMSSQRTFGGVLAGDIAVFASCAVMSYASSPSLEGSQASAAPFVAKARTQAKEALARADKPVANLDEMLASCPASARTAFMGSIVFVGGKVASMDAGAVAGCLDSKAMSDLYKTMGFSAIEAQDDGGKRCFYSSITKSHYCGSWMNSVCGKSCD